MNDKQLQRYSRHILLPQIQLEGQQKICDAKVLIVGLGGLGSAAALYLAASGVGHFILMDSDTVDLSNLQRQIAHNSQKIGTFKVDSAMQSMQALNPDIHVQAVSGNLTEENSRIYIEQADIILDCTDNFKTRFLLNKICWQAKKPLIMGAAIGFSGQVSVFDPRVEHSPCYACLYPQENIEKNEQACVHTGVLSPAVGVIGSLQAVECLKHIAQLGDLLIGRLLLWDALTQNWRTIKISKDPLCSVCHFSHKSLSSLPFETAAVRPPQGER